MNPIQLKQIAAWYAQSTDYLYLYSPTWELLWKNRNCPVLPSDAMPEIFQQAKPPCTAAIPYGGRLYTAQLELHALSEAPEDCCLMLRISKMPWEETQWQSTLWWQETENQTAVVRNQVFGISNAVSALYNMLEEADATYPDTLLQEGMEQLNIIKGNCCRLLQPSVCLSELATYYTKTDISPETVFLEQEMSNFEKSCRAVFGRRVRLHLDCPPHLPVLVHPERLLHAMLHLISLLCRKSPKISRIEIVGKGQSQAPVQLTCTGLQEGSDRVASRHSDPKPLYQTGLLSLEEQILQQFCQTYGVTLLSADAEEQWCYILRFPPCPEPNSLQISSPRKALEDGSFSLVQLVLADIADYRFY